MILIEEFLQSRELMRVSLKRIVIWNKSRNYTHKIEKNTF